MPSRAAMDRPSNPVDVGSRRGRWGIALAVGAVTLLFLVPSLPSVPGAGLTPAPPSPARGAPLEAGDLELAAARASLAGGAGPTAQSGGGIAANWTEVLPGATAGGLAAYDAADGYVLAWGGLLGAPGHPTWVYSRGNWTQPNISYHPPVYTGSSIAYDAADREVIWFGGQYTSTSYLSNGSAVRTPAYVNQTWAYRAGAWTNLTPNLSVAPSPRAGASMTYDARDGYLLLFGGLGGCRVCYGGFLNDTWEFSHGAWRQVPASGSSPSPREDAALAYDSAASEVVLFGGSGNWYPGPRHLNDTWTYVNGSWTPLSIRGPPGTKLDPRMAGVPGSGAFLLVGGSLLNSTRLWNFTGTAWRIVGTALSPGLYDVGSMVDDPVVGGLLLTAPSPWAFLSGAWSDIGLHPVPLRSPYDYATPPLAYDARGGYVVYFRLNETWIFDNGNWTDISRKVTGHPTERIGEAIAYDPASGTVVLFSGLAAHGYGGLGLGDTWEFNGTAWTNLSLSIHPSYLFGAEMTYDAKDGYLLLFGGSSPGSMPQPNQTWEFSNGSWTQLHPKVAPPPRALEGLAYDAAAGYVLMYGGVTWAGSGFAQYGSALSDSWSFSGGTWTNLTAAASPASGPGPGARFAMAFDYDPSAKAIVMFGGSADPRATWTFANGSWSSRSLADQIAPAPGIYARMVYVPGIQREFVYGTMTANVDYTQLRPLQPELWYLRLS